jgi:hypothetical protein
MTWVRGSVNGAGHFDADVRPDQRGDPRFKALRTFAKDDAEFRRFLHQLAGLLTAFPAASLWIGEYDASEIAILPEFAVADAIVHLVTVRSGEREMRFLQVRKLHGGSQPAEETNPLCALAPQPPAEKPAHPDPGRTQAAPPRGAVPCPRNHPAPEPALAVPC